LVHRFEPAFALAVACWTSGQTERGVETTATVGQIASGAGDPLNLAQARLTQMMAYLFTREPSGPAVAEHALRDAEETGNPHQLAFAYTCGLVLAAVNHDVEGARRAFAEAERWASVADNPFIQFQARFFLAVVAGEDRPDEALALIRAVLITCEESGYWNHLDSVLRRVVLPLVRLGRHRAAAVILGGMTVLSVRSPDNFGVAESVTPALQLALGDDLPRLIEQGRSFARLELVRLALDEIDACLEAVPSVE
jgi:hypothetical protein